MDKPSWPYSCLMLNALQFTKMMLSRLKQRHGVFAPPPLLILDPNLNPLDIPEMKRKEKIK